jgi:hypothetical protein
MTAPVCAETTMRKSFSEVVALSGQSRLPRGFSSAPPASGCGQCGQGSRPKKGSHAYTAQLTHKFRQRILDFQYECCATTQELAAIGRLRRQSVSGNRAYQARRGRRSRPGRCFRGACDTAGARYCSPSATPGAGRAVRDRRVDGVNHLRHTTLVALRDDTKAKDVRREAQ